MWCADAGVRIWGRRECSEDTARECHALKSHNEHRPERIKKHTQSLGALGGEEGAWTVTVDCKYPANGLIHFGV
jgi:hypothetical protein